MRFQVVPAAYVVLRRTGSGGDEVLLQLRRNTGYRDGYWAAGAAGHVEAGESVVAAAVREAREELGVDVHADDLVPLTTLHRTDGSDDPIEQRVDFFFECRTWRGDPQVRETPKVADLRWFALDALPDPVVPHEREVYERLRTGSLPVILPLGF